MAMNILPWIIVLVSVASAQKPADVPYKYRMAFGSCFKHQNHYRTSEIFDKVVDDIPASFVWLGDFAYLDKRVLGTGFVYNPMPVIKQLFDDSYNDPHYVPLRKKTKIYGVWDDHDSGINNSDKSNEHKEVVRQLFLDAMDEPADSPRRKQPGGMYGSYFVDPQKKVKLILLDNRYSRDTLTDTSLTFEEKSLLGEEQEKWLIQEVMQSEAHFTLIAVGNQLMPDDRPIIEKVFPKTRQLILTLHNPKTSIFLLTGDVHFGEILVDQCTKHLHGYPIHEFTSSGLSHCTRDFFTKNWTDAIVDFIFPDTFSTGKDRYHELNYGVLDFYIDPKNPENSSIEFRLKDFFGLTILHKYLKVGKDLPKVQTPDTKAYLSCLQERGPVRQRQIFNMIKKGINPTGVVFYMLAAVLLVLYFLAVLISKLCSRCSRYLRGAHKEKKD